MGPGLSPTHRHTARAQASLSIALAHSPGRPDLATHTHASRDCTRVPVRSRRRPPVIPLRSGAPRPSQVPPSARPLRRSPARRPGASAVLLRPGPSVRSRLPCLRRSSARPLRRSPARRLSLHASAAPGSGLPCPGLRLSATPSTAAALQGLPDSGLAGPGLAAGLYRFQATWFKKLSIL